MLVCRNVRSVCCLVLLHSVSAWFGLSKRPNVAPAVSVNPHFLEEAQATTTGQKISERYLLNLQGRGPPHTNAPLRIFGEDRGVPDLIFYRDSAAWCPYCQKVWILLEEKKISYRVEKINMRCYGDKSPEFLRKVPSGLLPVIEINTEILTESVDIMLWLDQTYSGPQHKRMWPSRSYAEYGRALQLMALERQLYSAWCVLHFRPNNPRQARAGFEQCLDRINAELQVESGPWFLPYMSIVDINFIPHVERACATVPYWAGFKIRGDGRWPAIERWIDAFEQLPSYMATKSDYYTTVTDIPPQCGEPVQLPGAAGFRGGIDGSDGSWNLPLPALSSATLEPVHPGIDPGEAAARHEAAYEMATKFDKVLTFALRGTGKPGQKKFSAPLSDPYAEPDLQEQAIVSACLRLVLLALMRGHEAVPATELRTIAEWPVSTRQKALLCLAYLRDRVGVPRDMSYPAARQLRAHLNWISTFLRSS